MCSGALSKVKSVIKDILISLKFFKKCGLIHSDLKPENIVFRLDSDQNVKVIDFGSATYIYEECQDYVQTRPYRAPEIIFGCDYNYAVDMWSVGCILYELLTSKVLFSQKNLHEIITQVISLEISKQIYSLQSNPDFEAENKKEIFSQNLHVKTHNRKLSILSKESDELWSKTSSKITNPKLNQSPNESNFNNDTSVKSEQNFSGKTEVKKFHSKANNMEKSQRSNDTTPNKNKKPARREKDFYIAQQILQNLSKIFEKFENGSRFKELVTKGNFYFEINFGWNE
jgi:serine/threonine protein kinase